MRKTNRNLRLCLRWNTASKIEYENYASSGQLNKNSTINWNLMFLMPLDFCSLEKSYFLMYNLKRKEWCSPLAKAWTAWFIKLMTSAIFCRGVISFFDISQKGIAMDFLTSIGVLLSCGLLLGSICKRLHLPSLIGMLIGSQMVLTAAVLTILAAAPIGALLIDCLYCRLLRKPE